MICTKCNNEIPEGAKFCPICGTAAASAEPKRCFCQKCGLELQQGARFCSVCGTPAGAPAEIKPTAAQPMADVSEMASVAPVAHEAAAAPKAAEPVMAAVGGAVSAPAAAEMPAPVEPIAPVSLEKTADDLVSAMNSASPAPAAYSAPAAAASFSAPAAPAADAAFAANTPAAPAFQGQTPQNGGAAVAVKPAKKSKAPMIIILSVCGVLVAALIAAAVFFFTNKSAFLSLFMGKPGYAAMVESDSIRSVSDKIDAKVLSESIKSGSGLAATLLTSRPMDSLPNISDLDISDLDPFAASKMSVSSAEMDLDFEELVKLLEQSMAETYDAKCATIKVSTDLSLTDTSKSQLVSSGLSKEDLEELLKYINSASFSSSVCADGASAGTFLEAEAGKLKVNMKVIADDDNNIYLVLPFASQKGLKIKVDPAGSVNASSEEQAVLELDEKEIDRLIEKITNIYLDHYKKAEIEMESGELSVAGVSANGKLITAKFDKDALSELFADIGDAIAEDKYFREAIVDFAKEYDIDIDEDDYEDGIKNAFDIEFGKKDSLTINTIITNNGDILGKTIEIASDKDGEKQTAKIGYLENKSEFAFELSVNGGKLITVNTEKEDAKNGVCTVKVSDTQGSGFTVKIEYNDFETVKWRKNYTSVGTVKVSVVLPADFTENNSIPDDVSEIISGAKIIISSKVVDESSLESSFALDVPQYGKLTLTSELTVSDDTSMLTTPSDCIDLTDMLNGNIDDDKAAQVYEELMNYLESITEALQNQDPDGLGAALSQGMGGILPNYGPDAAGLYDEIKVEYDELAGFKKDYNIDDAALNNKFNALAKEFKALMDDVQSKNGSMTTDEYKAARSKLETLCDKKEAIREEYENIAGNGSLPYDKIRAEDVNFESLDAIELTSTYLNYCLRMYTIEDSSRYMKIIEADPNMSAIYKSVQSKSDAAMNAMQELTSVMDRGGNLSLPLLRSARSAVKDFAYELEDLERAVSANA